MFIKKRYNLIQWQRYELEISDANVKKSKPNELEFTSRRDKYQRFHTARIKNLIDKLETAEERKEEAITPFICKIFFNFHSLHLIWFQLISCLSELDCLSSLAMISSKYFYY